MKNNILIPSEYVKFDAKPDAVPYKYRLSYRISITCLILKITGGRSGCSLTKIHLITISMYSTKSMDHLLAYLNEPKSNFLTLRFDPAVNKTINFMLADKIIYQQKNGLFRLSDKGKKFTQKLIRSNELLISEKSFLNNISTHLSEDIIKNISNTLLG
ncbi:hypothetical protein [Lysinibacillus halotolerans]|uniref:Uncharacterized protein n=1 Tax=Lysinibacillus halotolerans TaxID=1368476 RepID=A0A3M8H799_9BACI|nr:hypothetical protein [Lysinibacillus halotolerans]RNC98266.1 hypothetical protein EC501_11715 [Lysinibacillus halotolerans]